MLKEVKVLLHGICISAAYLVVHWFPQGDAHCCGIISYVTVFLSSSSQGKRKIMDECKIGGVQVDSVWVFFGHFIVAKVCQVHLIRPIHRLMVPDVKWI